MCITKGLKCVHCLINGQCALCIPSSHACRPRTDFRWGAALKKLSKRVGTTAVSYEGAPLDGSINAATLGSLEEQYVLCFKIILWCV